MLTIAEIFKLHRKYLKDVYIDISKLSDKKFKEQQEELKKRKYPLNKKFYLDFVKEKEKKLIKKLDTQKI